MSTAMEGGSGACLSCGAAVTGRFCSACGEKRVGAHDLQVGHLAHDFWHEVTHLDGKIWGSFGALLFKPGLLTRDYWEGRQGKWMRPLRIFLIITALALLLAPDAAGPLGLRVFAVKDEKGTRISIGQRPTTRPATTPPPQAAESGVHFTPGLGGSPARSDVWLDTRFTDEEIVQLNAKIFKNYKILQYLGLGVFAGIAWLLLRKKQPYYGGYLILALHFYSFEYVLTGVTNRLGLNPLVGLLIGYLYLTVCLWKVTGRGRDSERSYGVDWGSAWRALLMVWVVAMTELLAMNLAGLSALSMH